MVRKIKMEKGKIEVILEKTITKFGSGVKIDAPKEFLGKKVYIIVGK